MFNTRLRLNALLRTYNDQLEKIVNPRLKSDMGVYDIPAMIGQGREGSQLDKIRKKNVVKVAIIGDKAYWVHNNIFYQSDVINGYIDNEAAVPIDAHSLSKKELDKLLKVLDNIL